MANSMNLVLRALETRDFSKGFLQLLESLTSVGDVSEDAFKERLEEIQDRQPDYHVAVIEDASEQRVVATATLLVERKFIHGCGKRPRDREASTDPSPCFPVGLSWVPAGPCGQVGHIEDVVVDPGYRGQRLGQRLIEDLVGRAKAGGCYKVILDCSEDNAAFYEKCGLSRKEIQMVLYLDR